MEDEKKEAMDLIERINELGLGSYTIEDLVNEIEKLRSVSHSIAIDRMSLRNEFIEQLDINGSLDILFKNNNTDYIKWLENKLLNSEAK